MPRWSSLGRDDESRLGGPPLLILTSLAEGPKHGHSLSQDIEAFAGVRLGPGTLYGALSRLEQRGLIEPLDSDNRRRPYKLTAAGKAVLEVSLSELRTIVEEGSTRLGLGRALSTDPEIDLRGSVS
jgi:DNA-binding PadR family transcriptional regulator